MARVASKSARCARGYTAVGNQTRLEERSVNAHTWCYKGMLSEDRRSILGTLGSEGATYGTFSFVKGCGMGLKQAESIMLVPTNEIWGSIQDTKNLNGAARDDLVSFCRGFSRLRI